LGISGSLNLKKILLLGSSGFLGTNLRDYFEVNYSSEYKLINIEGKSQLDIKNFDLFNGFIEKNKPEIIINAAAFVGGIAYGSKFPAKILHDNSQIVLNIYESARLNNIEKVINPISNCAYPGDASLYKEEAFWDGKPHDSVFNYGFTRRLIVAHGDAYFSEYNLNSVNIVMSNMYGPHDHFDEERSHALGALINKIYNAKSLNEKNITIWGTGKPIREWLYVKDACEAIARSILLPNGHHFMNVGVNKGISISDLAKLISQKIEWNGEFIFDTSKQDGAMEKRVDGKYSNNLLNWMPETNLEKGIEETVDWYVREKRK